MDKRMETTIMGYIGTTMRIHSFKGRMITLSILVIWDFPKIRGTSLGIMIMRVVGVCIIGVPLFRETTICSVFRNFY